MLHVPLFTHRPPEPSHAADDVRSGLGLIRFQAPKDRFELTFQRWELGVEGCPNSLHVDAK